MYAKLMISQINRSEDAGNNYIKYLWKFSSNKAAFSNLCGKGELFKLTGRKNGWPFGKIQLDFSFLSPYTKINFRLIQYFKHNKQKTNKNTQKTLNFFNNNISPEAKISFKNRI